jgi:hypothetical protein
MYMLDEGNKETRTLYIVNTVACSAGGAKSQKPVAASASRVLSLAIVTVVFPKPLLTVRCTCRPQSS